MKGVHKRHEEVLRGLWGGPGGPEQDSTKLRFHRVLQGSADNLRDLIDNLVVRLLSLLGAFQVKGLNLFRFRRSSGGQPVSLRR